MDVSQFLSLFLIAFIFVITPGPGTLAVFAKSLSQGFIPAFYLSLGLVLGDLIYLSIVIFSLDLFSEAIMPMIGYIKIFGGLYLVYLGINAWNAHKVKLGFYTSHKTNAKEFLTGLLIASTNPKVIIFYIAVLPTFINLSQVTFTHALEILSTVSVGLILGISLINIAVVRIKQWFTKPGMEVRINQITGIVMIVAGILLGLL